MECDLITTYINKSGQITYQKCISTVSTFLSNTNLKFNKKEKDSKENYPIMHRKRCLGIEKKGTIKQLLYSDNCLLLKEFVQNFNWARHYALIMCYRL